MSTTTRPCRSTMLQGGQRSHGVVVVVLLVVMSLLVVQPVAADTSAVCEGAPVTVFADGDAIAEVHRANVTCMAAYGITVGVDAVPNFAPGNAVTRQQMATFIARLLTQARNGDTSIPSGFAPTFLDVLPGSTHAPAIGWLAELGITTGVTATTYAPARAVTREQMASFIARALDELGLFEILDRDTILAERDAPAFSDITEAAAVHRSNIEVLQALGVIGGFPDGTYRPGSDVNRQQMSRFIMESAALLDANGLWNGRFVDAADPGDPADPTTPTDPTDPTDPTNQAFTLMPGGAQAVPTGTEVVLDADVLDAEVVTVWLLDADTVRFDGQVVTMNLDGAGALDPGLVASGAAEITAVDGVALPAGTRVREVAVDDGALQLTVTGSMSPTEVVVVVTEGGQDAVVGAGGAALVDGDGALATRFGAAGPIVFADVEGIALLRATTGAPILGGNVPAEGTLSVAAALVTGLDLEPIVAASDVEDIVVPLDGEDIEVVVAELTTMVDSSSPAALAATTAAAAAECDALQDDPSTLLVGQVLDTRVAAVEEGVARIDLDGPGVEAYHCLLATFDGTATGAYAGVTATSYGPAADARAAGHGLVTWLQGDPVLTTLRFTATDENTAIEVGGAVSLQVQAQDQFDDPVAGAQLAFERVRLVPGVPIATDLLPRTTDAAGIATLTYLSDENRVDTVTASWTDPGDPLNVVALSGAFTTARVLFFEDAVPPAPGSTGDEYAGELVLATDTTMLINTDIPPGIAPPGAGPLIRLPYSPADFFGLNAEIVPFGVAQAALVAADPFALPILVGAENVLDQRPESFGALWEITTASLFGTDLPGPGNVTGDTQLIEFQLTALGGDPLEGVTLSFADDGAGAIAPPGVVLTDAGGRAVATYVPAPVADVGRTVTITATATVNGAPIRAQAIIVFD